MSTITWHTIRARGIQQVVAQNGSCAVAIHVANVLNDCVRVHQDHLDRDQQRRDERIQPTVKLQSCNDDVSCDVSLLFMVSRTDVLPIGKTALLAMLAAMLTLAAGVLSILWFRRLG